MRSICVNDQAVPCLQTVGGSACQVQNPSFRDEGDFQFPVPVAADGTILKIIDIVMIDLEWKIRCAVYTQFPETFVGLNALFHSWNPFKHTNDCNGQ